MEDNRQSVPETDITAGEVTTDNIQPEEVKTVTVEEMQRRINKEKQSYEELKSEIDRKIQDAVQRAKSEQAMSEDERVEAERAELVEKIKRLEAEQAQRVIKDRAVSRLSEVGLPVSEEVLGLVLRSSEDDTEASINNLNAIISAVKKTLVSDENLPISGGIAKKEPPKSVLGLYNEHKIK